jgi:hypothetical protein
MDFDKTFYLFGVKIRIQINLPGYWEIIHYGYSIGYCTDRESVLEEEPGSTFRRISKEEFENH